VTELLELAPVIVHARLRPPEPHPDELPRPRLTSLLDACDEPAILVAAPRGSGKSVLLSQWVRGSGARCAWISLGPRKADLCDLWCAILQALEPFGVHRFGTGALSLNDPVGLLDRVIPGLLNGLINTEPLVLVLDGLEHVEDAQAKESLTHFVLQLPQHVRTVLSTSRPAGGPAAVLKATGRLTELTAHELRFTASESHQLLERVARRSVSEDEASHVYRSVDGWAVGLRLSAVAMRRGHWGCLPREVVDYVRAEVLDKAAPEERAALLQTSILTELRSDLVTAVTGSWATRGLASFAGWSLFLEPTADGWVCHPALAAAAAEHLSHTEPAKRSALHTRAGLLLAEREDYVGAARHALEAGMTGDACAHLGAAWPAGSPDDVLEHAARLGDQIGGLAAVAAAAAALARGDGYQAKHLLHFHESAPCSVQALAHLQLGELAEARACIESPVVATDTQNWTVVVSELVTGYTELWDGHVETAAIALDHAARSAADIEYCDALVRALDGIVACQAIVKDHDRAVESARRAVAAHNCDPRRSTAPVIALAYLEATERGDRDHDCGGLAAAGADGGPHQMAFAEYLRASAARARGQQVAYRLALSRGRSVLTKERAGTLLATLLADQTSHDTSGSVASQRLTSRELAVLRALCGPLTLPEIAREFHLSHNTIKTHVSSLFRKLDAHDRASALRAGYERGLIPR